MRPCRRSSPPLAVDRERENPLASRAPGNNVASSTSTASLPSQSDDATAAAAAGVPRPEVDALFAMGFPRAAAARALRRSDGTIDGALDWLAEREEGGQMQALESVGATDVAAAQVVDPNNEAEKGAEEAKVSGRMSPPRIGVENSGSVKEFKSAVALNNVVKDSDGSVGATLKAKVAASAAGLLSQTSSPSERDVRPRKSVTASPRTTKPIFSGPNEEPPYPGDPPGLSETETTKKRPAVEVNPPTDSYPPQWDARHGRESYSSARPGQTGSRGNNEGDARVGASATSGSRSPTGLLRSIEGQSGRSSLERREASQREASQIVEGSESNRAGIGSGDADTLRTPVAHAVVFGEDDEGRGFGIGGAASAVLATATPAPPSTVRSRWPKIAVAVLLACVVGIGLAFGLSSRGQKDQSQASWKGGMSLPDFTSPPTMTAWPPSTTSSEQSNITEGGIMTETTASAGAASRSSTNPTTTTTTIITTTPAKGGTPTDPATTTTTATTVTPETTKWTLRTITATTSSTSTTTSTTTTPASSTKTTATTATTTTPETTKWTPATTTATAAKSMTTTSITPTATTTTRTATTTATTTTKPSTTAATTTTTTTTARAEALKNKICAALSATCDDLSSEGTPQSKALQWVISDSNFESFSEWRRIQRYVLAVVAFSLEGWGGLDSDGNDIVDWRNGAEEECSWAWGPEDCCDKIKCDSSERVTEIGFGFHNDLVATGKVPRDLALLSNSLQKLWFCCVDFSGSIPTELGMLSELKRLALWGNKLEGSIPSELGLLTNLEILYLEFNDLTGSMPAEVCALRTSEGQLKSLWTDCKAEVECAKPECCTDCE